MLGGDVRRCGKLIHPCVSAPIQPGLQTAGGGVRSCARMMALVCLEDPAADIFRTLRHGKGTVEAAQRPGDGAADDAGAEDGNIAGMQHGEDRPFVKAERAVRKEKELCRTRHSLLRLIRIAQTLNATLLCCSNLPQSRLSAFASLRGSGGKYFAQTRYVQPNGSGRVPH